MFYKRISILFHTALILALVLSWTASDVRAFSRLFVSQGASTGIYRTQVTFPNSSGRARLDTLGVTVLEESANGALVLANSDQLQSLARLRFQPRQSNELGLLLDAHSNDQPGLWKNLRPTLQGLDDPVASSPVALPLLTLEQRQILTSLAGVDDDGDGLSNTEESWWCTNPNNPNTDQDAQGYTDGQEVAALLDFTLPRSVRWGYGPPFGPPASWPNWNQTGGCNDGDYDTIPDFAEIYMVGSKVPEESTDHDKFDDGQELFGVTYCPGAPTSCGYGNYPRIEYWSYIKASMPAWVLPPGDNLFVAAFPEPEVSVVPGSWTVNRVTTITTLQGQMTQATHSYETSVMRGESTSIADTVTWNNWEEVSQAVETPIIISSHVKPIFDPGKFLWGSTKLVGGVATYVGGIVGGAFIGTTTCGQTLGLGCVAGYVVADLASDLGKTLTGSGFQDIYDSFAKDDSQNQEGVNKYSTPNVNNLSASAEAKAEVYLNQNFDMSGVVNSLDSVQYAINQQGQLLARGLKDISYQLSRPRLTETRTNGHSWGGAQTVTNEVYEEHTISEGEAFTSGENWSTAWAVDSSHAADLTFNYTIKNSGTEYARELTGLVFNIYLGDDKTPVISYPAWQQFPSGKLENLFPGNTHTFASNPVPLTLDQMKRIDLGERLVVVLEDYSYGADELFYQDAVNGGVTVFIEDGVDDNDELVDSYVIPTWGVETVQDVMTRYFPHSVDNEGNLNSLWTPEFNGINPPVWNEHYLSDIAWWNVYLSQSDAGDTPLQQLTAQAGSALLFRFNRDSDRDGYQDRVEMKFSTDKNDPASHPQPEVLAGYTATRTGNIVTVLLKVANFGSFDAYGIDAVMYSPDGTTTIGNNTVGGNGRVRPGHQVAVGSLVQAPDKASWTSSTAKPYAIGNYSGDVDKTFTFDINTPGVVGQGSTALNWSDGAGHSGLLNLGSSYHAPLPLDVYEGLQLGFDTGTALSGEAFTVQALTPRDTFTYTINSEPYTEPVIVVSYSDPQGSHKFITPVKLNSLSDDLSAHSGEMLPDARVEILTSGPMNPTGNNHTNFIINSPDAKPIQDAHLYLNFVADGELVAELPYTMNLEPGPTVFPVDWSTAVFTQTYDVNADNILIAFWTDSEGNIIDSAARLLNTFQEDPQAEAEISTTSWDFGSVTKGTLLKYEITLANTSLVPLRGYVSGTDAAFASPFITAQPGTFQTIHLTLDTAWLPVGAYNRTLTLRTNAPQHPQFDINISGIISALSGQAMAQNVDSGHPWDQYVFVPGSHNQGDTIMLDHNISDNPSQQHPLYVYSEDGGTLLGVGEFGPDFTGQTAPFGMFGDGSDGPQTISTNTTDDPIDSACSGTAGSNTLSASNPNFAIGQIILIHQSQGTGAGNWMRNIIINYTAGTITLDMPLNATYGTGAQVLVLKRYTNVTISNGVTWTTKAWNGTTGGIFAFLANGLVTINGTINASGNGYNLGGNGSHAGVGEQNGEGYLGVAPGQIYPIDNGGGARSDGGGGMAGAGGGHATKGGNGGQTNPPPPNQGGLAVGNESLSVMFFGGQGGGGNYTYGATGGRGGNGGGIILIYVNSLIITGNLSSNGQKGGDGNYNGGWATPAGGGAGGSVLIKAADVNIGTNLININGGNGGYRSASGTPGGKELFGGNGSVGRIRIEYCNSLSGVSNPTASAQKISCYITRQLPGSPNTELILPEIITDTVRYQLQFGQRGTFTIALSPQGFMDYTITLPKHTYSHFSLDALFENLGSSSFNFSLDIGANGSVEWSDSGTQQPLNKSSPELKTSLNAYLANAPGVWGTNISVPIRLTLDTSGDVFLTNIEALPGGDSDPQVGVGDLTASDTTPVETDLVTLTATIHNIGHLPAENVLASFFAGDPQAGGIFLGSNYIASIPASASSSASLVWDTTGYTGTVNVYVVLDAAGQVVELNENNNQTSLAITIRTRPDLLISAIQPQGSTRLGIAVNTWVNVANNGGTNASNQTVNLYLGDPDHGGILIGSQNVAVPAGGSANVTIPWTPSALGPVILYARADQQDVISEFNETNNTTSQSAYVGWGPPVYIDSGNATEQPYSTGIGFGYLTTGTPVTSCGSEPYQTYRQASSGQVLQYRFNHLLPERFYHLDLTFFLCSGSRTLRVLVDGIEIDHDIIVSNVPRYRSLTLDPSLYSDHEITITIEKTGGGLGGPVVSELKLTDIRYCYRDSGNTTEVTYTGALDGCGWLDGFDDQSWGTLAYQSVRYDDDGVVQYRFDRLEPGKNYRLNLAFFEGDAAGRVESVRIDGLIVLTGINLSASPQTIQIGIPSSTYADGTVLVEILDDYQPVISEIGLEEITSSGPQTKIYLPVVIR